ncbi:pyruvate, phosphate dikinase [Anaerotignum sp. MB30-C6]|uniref:pyruvate, phosphate dikinase n=1 Tax=Anaerotignum sp. MB30-C6 TaxID=3070814 RepID=UPI0027DCF62E|nr:pyruvate, phosphate dikinase [Anaerotignum sp. MB30-C6]WMI81428.1 pyruvate, phosphate dikinase [Anaerotignum sp. MB30-C6]
MSKKYVYMFSEGNASMKNLLGGKGANLAEMTMLGLPIPQGFTISTEACTEYNEGGKKLTKEMIAEIEVALGKLEEIAGKKLGDPENPLLVSVRSGARASMPGMMDTVLNLGLNDVSVEGLAKKTGNPRFAYDSYRRFIMMFADVVIGVSKSKFERKLDEYKEEVGVRIDTELTAEDLKKVTEMFKQIYFDDQGKEFPQDPKDQLFEAAMAVFRSWDNPRAFVYRRMNDIPYSWGTAVNVQMMVFGNMGDTSGTGVAFTRNAATGEKAMLGEYLVNAQGEDVVAGVRTPNPIAKLAEDMPAVYDQFMEIANKLENHYKDMQDMEFTVEEGKLYFLQTRNGKRTANAALRIAVEMVEEGLITKEEALMKVDPKQLDQILHPAFDPKALKAATPLGKGLPASPGAAAGKVCFTAEDAKLQAEGGNRVILVRLETSPEDIEGMAAAQGILTVRGGMTSHAAVVARGMGTCCVSGCEEIKMNETAKTFSLGGKTFKEGEYISLDGSTGNIYGEDIPTVDPEISGNFSKFMVWADEKRSLKVRTNADTPHDAQTAIDFGAEGIGLTRTEHMFFEGDRIMKFRKMILSDTVEERVAALKGIEPFQKEDFKGIYQAMQERPVTIRLLDPPLHEFMPNTEEEFEILAKETGKTVEELKVKARGLHELNPMMGHRGCRLAVSYPEIAQMQTRAIIEAAIEVSTEMNINIKPEIMIPLIGEIKELKYVKNTVVETAEMVMADKGKKLEYLVGTMIEIPRACLTADEIATEAEFFSFGTNDLTQMTYGLSRDDAGRILSDYIDRNIYECDPTARLDRTGVGMLMKWAVEKALPVRPDIHLGICGEHGGDPSSIEFCHLIGLDYVSCSPFRVPIARLAAAQAQINYPRETRKH